MNSAALIASTSLTPSSIMFAMASQNIFSMGDSFAMPYPLNICKAFVSLFIVISIAWQVRKDELGLKRLDKFIFYTYYYSVQQRYTEQNSI